MNGDISYLGVAANNTDDDILQREIQQIERK